MLLALERLLLTRELFDYTCLINTANLFGKVSQICLAKYRKSVWQSTANPFVIQSMSHIIQYVPMDCY